MKSLQTFGFIDIIYCYYIACLSCILDWIGINQATGTEIVKQLQTTRSVKHVMFLSYTPSLEQLDQI